jgi:hypothetical protein
VVDRRLALAEPEPCFSGIQGVCGERVNVRGVKRGAGLLVVYFAVVASVVG